MPAQRRPLAGAAGVIRHRARLLAFSAPAAALTIAVAATAAFAQGEVIGPDEGPEVNTGMGINPIDTAFEITSNPDKLPIELIYMRGFQQIKREERTTPFKAVLTDSSVSISVRIELPGFLNIADELKARDPMKQRNYIMTITDPFEAVRAGYLQPENVEDTSGFCFSLNARAPQVVSAASAKLKTEGSNLAKDAGKLYEGTYLLLLSEDDAWAKVAYCNPSFAVNYIRKRDIRDRLKYLYERQPAHIKRFIDQKRIFPRMTRDQLRMALGEPYKVVSLRAGKTQWVYIKGKASRSFYTFNGDALEEILEF